MKIELNALQIGLITSILREFGTTTTMNLRGYILGQQDALWQDTALVAKCCKGKCPADDGPEVALCTVLRTCPKGYHIYTTILTPRTEAQRHVKAQ